MAFNRDIYGVAFTIGLAVCFATANVILECSNEDNSDKKDEEKDDIEK